MLKQIEIYPRLFINVENDFDPNFTVLVLESIIRYMPECKCRLHPSMLKLYMDIFQIKEKEMADRINMSEKCIRKSITSDIVTDLTWNNEIVVRLDIYKTINKKVDTNDFYKLYNKLSSKNVKDRYEESKMLYLYKSGPIFTCVQHD